MQRNWKAGRWTPLVGMLLAGALFAAPAAGAVPRWTVQSTPALSREAVLYAVSCSSSEFCMAVGQYNRSRPLLEKWNGHEWTAEEGSEGGLYGVSCVSSSFCVASGYDGSNSGGESSALTETWNGTSWTAHKSGWPGVLYGIACTSTTDCTAVGQNEGAQVLVEIWNGVGWEHEHGASSGIIGAGPELRGVSCAWKEYCTAVGSYYSSTLGKYQTLVERREGKYWAVSPSGDTSSGNNTLAGVGCTSEAFCKGVGSAEGNMLILSGKEGRLNSIDTNPSEASGDELRGVSCVSSSDCLATGPGNKVEKDKPVATTWNGAKWTLLSPVAPEGEIQANLEAVSCKLLYGVTYCTAVGWMMNSKVAFRPLVERYEQE